MVRRYNTIKDIAKALSISVATVSRALRNTYDVSEETRQKVLDMAAVLNYKPNLNAQGLVQKSNYNIGVIIPAITNYYFSTVITGIQEIAQLNGYHVILYLTNDSPEQELRLVKNLPLSNLDGLLACVSSQSDSCMHFQEITDEGFPLVFFDRVAGGPQTSKVMQDDYNGAFMAVEHLIQKGYKTIAHITGPKDLLLTRNRLNGYLDALKKYDLPFNENMVLHSGFSQKAGEADTLALFHRKKILPDAIFAVNDRKAIGAILALKGMKIQVGKDFGVIGFTNDPMSEIISPTLSTVAEPALQIGRISCELLIKKIKKENFPAEQIILPGELIERESSNKIPVVGC